MPTAWAEGAGAFLGIAPREVESGGGRWILSDHESFLLTELLARDASCACVGQKHRVLIAVAAAGLTLVQPVSATMQGEFKS